MERESAYHETTKSMRGGFIGMIEAGSSINEVAKRFGVHKKTVRRWVARYHSEGSISTKPRSGRPRRTSEAQDAAVLDHVHSHPFTTSKDIVRQLALPCSGRTVIRRLVENNISHHIPAKKPLLSEQQKLVRLNFARTYLDREDDVWYKAVFCDDTTFSTECHGPSHCYHTRGTRYLEANIQTTEWNRRVNVGVWGWMSVVGIGEVTRIEGRLTAEQYVDILSDVLLPSVRAYFIPQGEPFYLIHNNSPIHTSLVVRQWIDNSDDIITIDWPANSPDLNPIEDVWCTIVEEFGDTVLRNEVNLLRHVTEVWESLRRTPNYFESLVTSMRRRLSDVIEADGGYGEY